MTSPLTSSIVKRKEEIKNMAQAAETKRGKGRLNGIGKFWIGLVDEQVMRTFIEKNASEAIDIEGCDAEQIGVALTAYFEGVTKDPERNLAACPTCAGKGPDGLPACPYCGLEFDDDEEADGEDEEAEPADEVEVEVVAAPKGKKKTSSKKEESTAMTTTNGTNGVTLVKGKGAPLGSPAPAAVKQTVAQLDETINEITRLKTTAVGSMLNLAREIKKIHGPGLWKLRMKNGEARWKSFDQFCNAELRMVPSMAYDLMKAADRYTDDDAAKLGKTKLMLMLKAPEDAQDEIKKAAEEEHLTKRQVADRVKQANEDAAAKGKPKPLTKKQAAGKAGGKKKAANALAKKGKAADDRITVASILGKQTIKLYQKPASMKHLDLEVLKQASTLGKGVIGRIVLQNEVSMWFEIKKSTKGNLLAVFDVRRDG